MNKKRIILGILLIFGMVFFCFTEEDVTKWKVVLQLPKMADVKIKQISFKTDDKVKLRMDIYYPPEFDFKSELPVVIFINQGIMQLPEWRCYKDWGRLVAVSGIIGVTYQSRSWSDSMEDSKDLIGYIRDNSESLNINKNRLAIWACSANTYVGLPLALKKDKDYIRCAVFYYGIGGDDFSTLKPFRQDVPFFIVRSALDSFFTNRNIDKFIFEALDADMDFELVNYLEGHHAFDIADDNERSREMSCQFLCCS